MGICMFILVPLLIGASSSFLLDGRCSNGDVCWCSQDSIYCEGKGLTEVPAFNISGQNVDIQDFSLRNNNISILKNNTFSSLQGYVSGTLSMACNQNNISVLEDDCFKGLEDNIFQLNLENNKLQAIPMAVTRLNRIGVLFLKFNPIHVLDRTILSRLGNTISTISFSFEHFQRWPYELRFLFKLQSLSISKYNSTSIKISDFHYMTNMQLTKFEISNSRLEEFPVSICDFNNLMVLDISINAFMYKSVDFFGVCHTPITNLIILYMQGNDFDVLPDIGKTFPALRLLRFSENSLRYISSELTPMPHLENLDLSSNKLVHFPSALANLVPNIQAIIMRNNFIVDIGNVDFISFSHLQSLTLDDNPLEYIAASAFSHNPALGMLALSSTKLLTVPCALTSLSSQRITVNLWNDTFECDCRIHCLSNINLSKFTFGWEPQCTQPRISITEFIRTVIKANACATK